MPTKETGAREELGLEKIRAGLYQITGTTWAIGRTADHSEGPRGGTRARWELRRWDGRDWVIEPLESFGRLREAWDWVLGHPERVIAPESAATHA